jgi:hypothetical protein
LAALSNPPPVDSEDKEALEEAWNRFLYAEGLGAYDPVKAPHRKRPSPGRGRWSGVSGTDKVQTNHDEAEAQWLERGDDDLDSDDRGYSIEYPALHDRAGRPPRGTKDPARAKELIEQDTGCAMDELSRLLRPGRPTQGSGRKRELLARAVARLRDEQLATTEAIRIALGCDSERTVQRLAEDGRNG